MNIFALIMIFWCGAWFGYDITHLQLDPTKSPVSDAVGMTVQACIGVFYIFTLYRKLSISTKI